MRAALAALFLTTAAAAAGKHRPPKLPGHARPPVLIAPAPRPVPPPPQPAAISGATTISGNVTIGG